jgi:hypothetical protein
MSAQPLTWPAIFELWRDPGSPTDGRLARRLADDMGVNFELARQWHRSGAIPANYWMRLVKVIARRFGIAVSCDELARETEKLRPPKLRQEAA